MPHGGAGEPASFAGFGKRSFLGNRKPSSLPQLLRRPGEIQAFFYTPPGAQVKVRAPKAPIVPNVEATATPRTRVRRLAVVRDLPCNAGGMPARYRRWTGTG